MKNESHPLYKTWEGMNQRCNNPNNVAYRWYGGRGIRICERWRDFKKFVKDVGRKPSRAHTLDRVNSDGNYEPGNVRWSTRTEQSINTRIRSDNKSGQRGVIQYPRTGRWMAYVNFQGKRVHLGFYEKFEDAAKVRLEAEGHMLDPVRAAAFVAKLKAQRAKLPNVGRYVAGRVRLRDELAGVSGHDRDIRGDVRERR